MKTWWLMLFLVTLLAPQARADAWAERAAAIESSLQADPYQVADFPDGLPETASNTVELKAIEGWATRMHEAHPECFRYEYYLADIAAVQDRWLDARAHYEAAVRLAPAQPACLAGLATCVQTLNGTAAALPLYRQAFLMAPDNDQLRDAYALALQRLRRHHDALQVFKGTDAAAEALSYAALGYGTVLPQPTPNLFSLACQTADPHDEEPPVCRLDVLDRQRGRTDRDIWYRARIAALQRNGQHQAAAHALADYLQERPRHEPWAWAEVTALAHYAEARPVLRQRLQQIVKAEPGNLPARRTLEKLQP